MDAFFHRLHTVGISAVVEIDSEEDAKPLTDALLAGGLPIVEITLRTEAALESISRIARDVPAALIGAGTVLNRDQARAAREAGAQFIVCPGMIDEVVIWSQENEIPVLAGAVTATEMIRGINLGLNPLKFFPAETLGGVKAIRAISDPFPRLRFVPSGGVRLENLAEYLRSEKVHAVGGSWMAKRALIAEGRFDEIRKKAVEASRLVQEVRAAQAER